MNTNTPPIIRGEFVYHNVLLVDAGGDLKRHPRASLGDIKTLLDGKTPKDQVAHFYEAQLIHYGLQRSKDKNTAKVRLQQALNQNKLVVPPHIVDMEAQMKKEFAASVRKANKSSTPASKAIETSASGSGGAAPGKKRKQSGEEESSVVASKKTSITMKVGDVEFTIDHDSNEIASGTSKKATKATATSKTKATPAPAAKTPQKKAAPQNDTKAKATTTKKATEAQAKATAKEKVTKHPAKPKAEKSTAVKKEPKVKKEPTPKATQTKVKQEPIKQEPIKREPSPSPPLQDYPEIHYLTGVYDVSCPQLEDQLPATTGTLRLFICVDEAARKVWGGFELGPKRGVILIAEYHDDPIQLGLTFGWRARDLDRGGLDFGRGCYGDIEFVGGGIVAGTFYNLFPEPVEFQGKRRSGPLVCSMGPWDPVRSAWDFEQRWDGFVTEAYGR
jgi:hypothetical protein